LGSVAAGRPIEALETADSLAVPEEFIRRRNTFVLRVTGDSMVGDGILDRDFIVVEERPSAENGETVVATIAGAATVKRFYREKGGRVRLQPANSAMEPIIVRDRDVEIRGVIVARTRKCRSPTVRSGRRGRRARMWRCRRLRTSLADLHCRWFRSKARAKRRS
jgi:repressor LexA